MSGALLLLLILHLSFIVYGRTNADGEYPCVHYQLPAKSVHHSYLMYELMDLIAPRHAI